MATFSLLKGLIDALPQVPPQFFSGLGGEEEGYSGPDEAADDESTDYWRHHVC